MSPGLLLIALVAMLLAMLPVWRLHLAGWRPGILFSAWVAYSVAMLAVVRAPGLARYVLPILVLAFVAPFVAGPERLSRVMGTRPPKPRPVIDVTPPPPPGLSTPPRDVTPDEPGDAAATNGSGGRGGTDGADGAGSRERRP